MSAPRDADARRWRANLALIALLLLPWAATIVLVCLPPSNTSIAYWIGAQGSVLVYLVLTCVYAWATNRRTRRKG